MISRDKYLIAHLVAAVGLLFLVVLMVTMLSYHPYTAVDYPSMDWEGFALAAGRQAALDADGRGAVVSVRVSVLFLRWAFGYMAFPQLLLLALLIVFLTKGRNIRALLKTGYYGMLMTLILAISGAFLPARFSHYMIGVFWTGAGGVVRDAFGDLVAWVMVLLLIALLVVQLRPSIGRVLNKFNQLPPKAGDNDNPVVNTAYEPVFEEPGVELHFLPEQDMGDPDVEMIVHEPVESYRCEDVPPPDRPPAPEPYVYRLPTIDLLDSPADDRGVLSSEAHDEYCRALELKFDNLGVHVESVEAGVYGGLIRFRVRFAPRVLIRQVLALEKDIAMALAARSIRISAPQPGERAVVIDAHMVGSPGGSCLRSIVGSDAFRSYRGHLPVILGEEDDGKVVLDDLTKMPHLLVIAQSATEKSSFLDGLVCGLLYAGTPDRVRFVFIETGDNSLFRYGSLKHTFIPRFSDVDDPVIRHPDEALYVLRSVAKEMDLRYLRMRLDGDWMSSDQHFPHLVVLLDDISELMNARRDIEEVVRQLVLRGAAAGIHLVLSTRRPLAASLARVMAEGLISRAVFRLDDRDASKAVLGAKGAERLHGHGEMIFRSAQSSVFRYVWGVRVSDTEIFHILSFISDQEKSVRGLWCGGDPPQWGSDDNGPRDPAFGEAARLVVMSQQGSTSLLQRRLRLGFARAGRLMDQLEDAGIVGPQDGSRARDVLVSDPEELERRLKCLHDDTW